MTNKTVFRFQFVPSSGILIDILTSKSSFINLFEVEHFSKQFYEE